MGHNHDAIYSALSIGVAILAAWTSLGLLERVRENFYLRRWMWLGTTGFAMGGGIWAMHFIAMLGFKPDAPVSYSIPLTILSFFLAVVGTCGAFWVAVRSDVSRKPLLIAGGAMGASIAMMHYVGMAAIQTPAEIHHKIPYVLASIILATLASTTALRLVRAKLDTVQKAIAAVLLGLAVCAMHYTGMAGVTVILPDTVSTHYHQDSTLPLAISITVMVLLILAMTLITAHLDRRIKFLSVLDAGDIGYWEVQLPSRHLWLSPYAKRLLKSMPDDAGVDPRNALVEIAIAMAKRTLRNPNSVGRKEAEIRIGERWLSVRGRMIHRRRDHHIKMGGVLIDITESHTTRIALEVSDARQKLLLHELNHRLKNNFASIQSIATLTARGSPDLPSFIQTFESRLLALSNTQTLLTNEGWESADLVAIFNQELNPYTERAIIEGPPLRLDAKRALSMGLIAHELTTNAAKHGALKQAGGSIHVRWTHPTPEGRIRLEWRESGGPEVTPPKGKGFGSRLIRSSIEGPLAGTAQVDYLPAGLRVTLNFLLRDEPVKSTPPKEKGTSTEVP